MIEIAICDDDRNDLKALSQIICELCRNEAVNYRLNTFSSGKKLLESTYSIDVGILDISMNEINGIELGRKLKKKFPEVRLIYTTSFRQYCEQAINQVHAFSFLVKPVKYDDLKMQFLELLNQMENDISGCKHDFYNVVTKDNQKLEVLTLCLKDILYFESIKTAREINILCKDGSYKFPYLMKNLENELKPFGFEVNCRGMLVNMRHVKKIKGYSVYMDNGDIVALSQKRKAYFMEAINEFINNNYN